MYAICFNGEQISKIYFGKKNLADQWLSLLLKRRGTLTMRKYKEYIFKGIKQSRYTENNCINPIPFDVLLFK